jgi:hypothetical protein
MQIWNQKLMMKLFGVGLFYSLFEGVECGNDLYCRSLKIRNITYQNGKISKFKECM